MIPILYKSAEVDFTTNGLGLLNDIYSVDIQEQRNGLLTLTASYPTNAKHYKEIETGRIIYAKPNPLDGAQAFRIVKTELDISGYNLNIEADHITYDLTHNLVKEVHLQGDGQNAMTHLQNATVTPHLFRFVSDLQHLGDSRLQYVNPMEAIAGTEGSILQIWGGELHRDNRTVSMLSRRGRDNFTTFRLGKNINGLKYTVDMSNVTTRIVPTVTKSDATDNDKAYFVVGDTVDSKNLNKYPNVYIQHVDMGEKVTINEGETDEQIKAKIDKQAKNWFTQSANTGIDLPQVTVEIDVTSLQDSADYQEKFRNLESVGLTDTVSVYVPEFNVNVTAIVNELHYDPVAERVTSLVVGTSKKSFADNNSNALAELQNSITQIRQDATTAIVSSNGKNTNYYGTEEPAHPVEGDLWFKQVGDETYLMIFKDGRWQEWVSTKTQEEIAKKVDDAVKKAKEYTDELNEKQAEEVQKFQSEANAALSSAAAERTVFSSNATSMATSAATHADSMANSAATYGKAQAASALSSANSALTTAKSDLTTAIEQEISDRNKAVQTVNSQAQDYADQAKSDAIEAAKTADGQVRKDFKVTTDALSSTISQNKQDSDGKISTAQSTATQALNGLSTKVSQTDYDKKTGDLSTKVNTATQTATETKNELAKVSKTVDSQSAKINTISNTVDGTTQTISDIKTEQGKQSGSIAKLQSRADGFEATVTKVNNLSVGGRNLLLDTSKIVTQQGAGSDSVNGNFNAGGGLFTFSNKMTTGLFFNKDPKAKYTLSYDWSVEGDNPSGQFNPQLTNAPWGLGGVAVKPSETNKSGHSVTKFQIQPSWKDTSAWGIIFRQDHLVGKVTITNMKLEIGTVPTDWTPAPEDLSGATAKAQLTADKANLDLSKYKTDADGRISKAQSDITATANEVKTKVSQSDFDTKTGDLSTKYGQVKATADAVTTEVSNYKIANDKKVSANTASINTLNNQITSKVSQTDFDKKTGELNGKFTQQKQTVDSISQTVTELQAKANAQGQINQLMNTEFNPDFAGWYSGQSVQAVGKEFKTSPLISDSTGWSLADGKYNGSNVLRKTVGIGDGLHSDLIQVQSGSKISISMTYYNSSDYDGNVPMAFYIRFYDADKKYISVTAFNHPTSPSFKVGTLTVNVPSNAVYVSLNMLYDGNVGTIYYSQPMLVFSDHVGDYAPGNYNNNSRVSALEVDLNGITQTVKDTKNGLSATNKLASDGNTLAIKAQKDATTAITTAKGIQTQVNSNDGDIKSLQSITTQTADQVTTEIKDRKNGDKSVRTDMANLIDQRVKSVTDNYESAISQSADTIMASVSSLSTPNQLLNTEFNPDLEGWSISADNGSTAPYRSCFQSKINATIVEFNTTSASASTYARFYQTVQLSSTPGSGHAISMSWYAHTGRTDKYNNLWVRFYDNSNTKVSESYKNWADPSGKNSWDVQNKWENISIPDTATYVVISFEAREGTQAYLGHPMLVFGSTIGDTYMPGSYSGMNTSTVLELFKDNWALGIADNAGRLISGINGDTSGTVIQGKKLVINSDTTINGKAFIDGSVIKNASIGTAQIGKAAVGSAQIINVDVSKISGNIANFITGNINTLNSNVLYGDTGYLGTVNTGRVINNQDHHLQLASHGQYNSKTHRAQFELLSYDDPAIGDDRKGSLNYYSTVSTSETRGIRFKANHILAIDTYRNGAGNLYLSAYARGEVRITNRDGDQYAPIAASNFRVASQRSLKSDITDLKDGALNVVNSVKIHEYTKSGVSEIGVITDEVPDLLKTNDGKSISLYDYTSVLYKAVQELSAQVKELQNERPNN